VSRPSAVKTHIMLGNWAKKTGKILHLALCFISFLYIYASALQKYNLPPSLASSLSRAIYIIRFDTFHWGDRVDIDMHIHIR